MPQDVAVKVDRSRAATLVIEPSDRGRKSDDLDLALWYDPATRAYYYRR